MAKNDNLKDFLTDVADAIRESEGSSEKINPQHFSARIRDMRPFNLFPEGVPDEPVEIYPISDIPEKYRTVYNALTNNYLDEYYITKRTVTDSSGARYTVFPVFVRGTWDTGTEVVDLDDMMAYMITGGVGLVFNAYNDEILYEGELDYIDYSIIVAANESHLLIFTQEM